MNGLRKIICLLALLLAGAGLPPAVRAQAAAAEPPPLPPLKCPVDKFRELLALGAEQRQQALAAEPAEKRERLLAKLREYQALTPEARELRLRATELRWWLLPLMPQPATHRAAQLAAIPPDLRKLVDDRLAQWDLLPSGLQQELLEKEETAQLEALTVRQRQQRLAGLPPAQRAALEAGLTHWRALSESQRRATCAHFDSYFNLTAREQKKVLNTFSETERRQMEQTLRSFESLSLDKRRACVRSFEKFANLSPAERQQFLKNAERWQQMSLAERAAWRNLVHTVTDWPPLPPGFGETLPPPLPAAPPAKPAPRTNGG